MVSLSKVRRPGSLGSLLCLCCLTQACLLLPVSCTSVIPRHPWPPWEQDTTFSDLSFLTGDSLAQAHLSLQSTILITGTSPQKEESRCALPSSSPKQLGKEERLEPLGLASNPARLSAFRNICFLIWEGEPPPCSPQSLLRELNTMHKTCGIHSNTVPYAQLVYKCLVQQAFHSEATGACICDFFCLL